MWLFLSDFYITVILTTILKMSFNRLAILEKSRSFFNGAPEPLIVRSPGRVNIIGEHTDYNEGFVLPAAIDKAVYVAAAKRNDDLIVLYAAEFDDNYETSLSSLQKTDKSWPNYILGIADQLQKEELPLSGFSLYIDGNIPIGAGMSSSAALECATLFALNELFGFNLTRAQMATMAQKAEHEFAGVKCGIMDMFASLFGKKDHVISLDCRDLSYKYVPLKLDGYKLLLLNTNVKHNLASSEYNTRRQQCEQGVQWIKAHQPEVQSLRDVSLSMLDKYVLPKDSLVYSRCKYVVEENSRLLSACEDLQNSDVAALGKKMFATHTGLSTDYAVSCKELDLLVEYVQNNPAVLGARMMGGGFGGCTINIVKEEVIDKLVNTLAPVYKQATGLDLSYYVTSPEEGTSLL
jgi:galactokinase